MSEKSEIKRDGAKAQPNSGRGKHKKGDAILWPFCVDIKEYESSFGVSRENWAKICTDAFNSGSYEPAFKLVLGKERPVRVWVVGDTMFHQMREAWIEKYGDENDS